MKTFFTIIYVPISAAFDEKVSVGLMLSDGENHYFKYSSRKLAVIKGLLNDQSHSLVNEYLRSLDKDINRKFQLMDEFITKGDNWVNEPYVSYLSKYSNNLIQFSKPVDIMADFNERLFKILFEKYIYQFEEEVVKTIDSIDVFEKVKNNLYPLIANNVNIDRTITPSDFENLFTPIQVNFIGINGRPVSGQTVDFGKKHYALENDLARYISLTKALDLEIKREGKYFVLGKEPHKTTKKNHSIWLQIMQSNFLEFVDVDEVELVKNYIINNNVSPLFK